MRILIADDEKEIVAFLKEALSAEGHMVDTALDGKKALDLIKQNRHDVIFVDHNMPEKTGLELVKYIKENKLRVRTVMMTGYPLMKDFFAKSAGADEYLAKPFKLEDVDCIINKYSNGNQ
ncbi:MAG: response regulator [Candidatus Omnitrophica bacterium]|nr:response regulator [Candidatus Omnitrophota bacterium]